MLSNTKQLFYNSFLRIILLLERLTSNKQQLQGNKQKKNKRKNKTKTKTKIKNKTKKKLMIQHVQKIINKKKKNMYINMDKKYMKLIRQNILEYNIHAINPATLFVSLSLLNAL